LSDIDEGKKYKEKRKKTGKRVDLLPTSSNKMQLTEMSVSYTYLPWLLGQ
jgi:hypothetical protein